MTLSHRVAVVKQKMVPYGAGLIPISFTEADDFHHSQFCGNDSLSSFELGGSSGTCACGVCGCLDVVQTAGGRCERGIVLHGRPVCVVVCAAFSF